MTSWLREICPDIEKMKKTVKLNPQTLEHLLPHPLIHQDSHHFRQSTAILLPDRYLLPGQIDILVVKGLHPPDGNDIAPVDATKHLPRQHPLPLLQRHEYHDRRPVLHHQPGIILPGLDVQNILKVNFYVPAFMANKEKGLHLL
jgi:hypothetical protein